MSDSKPLSDEEPWLDTQLRNPKVRAAYDDETVSHYRREWSERHPLIEIIGRLRAELSAAKARIAELEDR